jgi:hypothetical protein
MQDFENPSSVAEIESPSTEAQENSWNSYLRLVSDIDPNSPDLANQLSEQRFALRDKYNLPDVRAVARGEKSPEQYYNELISLSESEGVGVSYDLEEFAEINNLPEGCTGMYSDDIDNRIHLASTFDRTKPPSIIILEHELVHALQYKREKEMPIEKKEYEAYLIASGNMGILENPKFRDMLFSLMIMSSTYFYEQNGQKVPWGN